MPSLSVRKIDEETLQQLRIQAAKHRASIEEEVRQILKRTQPLNAWVTWQLDYSAQLMVTKN